MKLLTRAVLFLIVALTIPAGAQINYLGGAGVIAFGVTPYGGAPPGVPTYTIPNAFNGRFDILTSPGGTFLTANPIIPNNISSIGPLGLPMFGFQVGGANGFGPFGTGSIAITGPKVGFSMTDAFPGGGSASYGLGSWNASFNSPLGYVGPFGSYLSIAGSLPLINSAGVAALRTHITSANPASPFFGGGAGIDLPQLVLAISVVAGPFPTYSFVALGGSGAAMLADPFGNFRGLAINNAGLVIPAGDAFIAESTLTLYADPMSFGAYDPTFDPALIAATGTTLPAQSLITGIPEPASFTLFGLSLVLFGFFRKLKS